MNQNTLENATSSHLHMQSQVVDLSELKSTMWLRRLEE